ncbi:MAG: helix-turn-helix domain-containing protein [Planctomycetia bacterium]
MRRAIPTSKPSRGARTPASRDSAAERKQFLDSIAPGSHFHRVFDGLDDVLFFARNRAGEILFFSRGIQPHDALAHDGQDAGVDDDARSRCRPAPEYVATDRDVIESQKPSLGHVEMWFDEVGLPDWYEVNKYPIFDRKGAVIGVMGTLRRFRGAAPGNAAFGRLAPALAILGNDLQKFPPLERLAAACRMSPRNLQRAFHDVFDFGPRDYWMKCRIRAACAALRAGAKSQTDIALSLGFCDQANFSQHFHRHTGITPSAYSRQARPTKRGAQ